MAAEDVIEGSRRCETLHNKCPTIIKGKCFFTGSEGTRRLVRTEYEGIRVPVYFHYVHSLDSKEEEEGRYHKEKREYMAYYFCSNDCMTEYLQDIKSNDARDPVPQPANGRVIEVKTMCDIVADWRYDR